MGDPAAEEPPMKHSLEYPKTKKLSASGGLTPDQPGPRWGLSPRPLYIVTTVSIHFSCAFVIW